MNHHEFLRLDAGEHQLPDGAVSHFLDLKREHQRWQGKSVFTVEYVRWFSYNRLANIYIYTVYIYTQYIYIYIIYKVYIYNYMYIIYVRASCFPICVLKKTLTLICFIHLYNVITYGSLLNTSPRWTSTRASSKMLLTIFAVASTVSSQERSSLSDWITYIGTKWI